MLNLWAINDSRTEPIISVKTLDLGAKDVNFKHKQGTY
jgi:hypothetical protein